MDDQEKTARATRHVEALLGFYIHLIVFVLVMALLFGVNRFATPNVWWVQWPLLGWSIGVIAHALAVFGTAPNFLTRWKQRKIEQLKGRI
jgi:hypothetical protein